MPKRTEVIAKIRKAAKAKGLRLESVRKGANHEIFDLDGVMVPIGNHKILDGYLALKIYKECEPKLGKGWWR
ncbi:HicA-like toxin [Mycobacterium phage Curiosium]|uniref:HicA-like toxin n=1 Tax=Mycobacterium phage Curiosium TaxID=2599859 RepID=A0A5J6TTJ0_9CAUD|nr:HicA-like toxin [Mycobacterium phage Curiosium]QFG14145.1 HicA-like toxin [Mycobacterium phage Curiosium]